MIYIVGIILIPIYMKSLKNLSILIVSLVLFCSFSLKDSPSYVGKWKGEDKGDIGYLTLTKDGYALFEFEGQILGGKSFTMRGNEASMHYEVEKKENYYHIDFIIKQLKDDETLGTLEGIFKMNSESQMVLAVGFDGSPRPTNFESDAITLNKID